MDFKIVFDTAFFTVENLIWVLSGFVFALVAVKAFRNSCESVTIHYRAVHWVVCVLSCVAAFKCFAHIA